MSVIQNWSTQLLTHPVTPYPRNLDIQPIWAVRHQDQFKRFLHGVTRPYETVSKQYKKSYCISVLEGVECNYGSRCQFAHSLVEKYHYNISANLQYKTSACQHLFSAYCPYNEKCEFGHLGDLMRKVNEFLGWGNRDDTVFYILEDPEGEKLEIEQFLMQATSPRASYNPT